MNKKILGVIMDKVAKILPYLGVVWFIVIVSLDTNLPSNQQNFLAIFVMVFWGWIFSRVPLFALGLFGVALTVVFTISNVKAAFAPFFSNIILLFLGGFLLARAMGTTGLDKRISFYLLSRSFIGGSFRRMLFSLMFVTAFFSMWMSNTATTAMMLPIILGIMKSIDIEDEKVTSLLLLGLAYSASIGGIGTPIGSPPNVVAIGFLQKLTNIKIEFLDWMIFSVPLMIVLFGLLFIYIIFKLPNTLRTFDQKVIHDMRDKLPPISLKEVILVIVFLTTVAFWFLPSLLKLVAPENKELISFVAKSFPSGNVAVFFASLLFFFPLKFPFTFGHQEAEEKGVDEHGKRKRKLIAVLGLDDIKGIDWGSLLLFGAGLSLGGIFFETGTATWMAGLLENYLAGASLIFVLFVAVYLTIFGTEMISNTATANILIPIIIAIALQFNIDPVILSLGVALAASMAFMLPVATPPNAIVYGTELVDKQSMIYLGFLLNILFGLLLSLYLYTFAGAIRALL